MNSDGLLLLFLGVLVITQATAGGGIDRLAKLTQARTK